MTSNNISKLITMAELEQRTVQSTLATNIQGCYQCDNFDKAENTGCVHVFINFKDKSRVRLCGNHFLKFKQRRK